MKKFKSEFQQEYLSEDQMEEQRQELQAQEQQLQLNANATGPKKPSYLSKPNFLQKLFKNKKTNKPSKPKAKFEFSDKNIDRIITVIGCTITLIVVLVISINNMNFSSIGDELAKELGFESIAQVEQIVEEVNAPFEPTLTDPLANKPETDKYNQFSKYINENHKTDIATFTCVQAIEAGNITSFVIKADMAPLNELIKDFTQDFVVKDMYIFFNLENGQNKITDVTINNISEQSTSAVIEALGGSALLQEVAQIINQWKSLYISV